MEVVTKTTLDMLTKDGVSIKTERFVGNEALGLPHRKAYVNSTRGRAELQAEVAKPYLSSILSVWGDEPTVSLQGGDE